MRCLIFACVVLIGCTVQAGATAVRPAAMVPPLSGALPAPEGVDCSIELGLAVCARYCTLDVDGRRLCLNRTEDVRPRVQLEEPRPLRLVPLN